MARRYAAAFDANMPFMLPYAACLRHDACYDALYAACRYARADFSSLMMPCFR